MQEACHPLAPRPCVQASSTGFPTGAQFDRMAGSSNTTASCANSGFSGIVEMPAYGCLIAGLQCPAGSCVSDQWVGPEGRLGTLLGQRGGGSVQPAGGFANLDTISQNCSQTEQRMLLHRGCRFHLRPWQSIYTIAISSTRHGKPPQSADC